MNKNKVGLTLGALGAILHLVWSVLVMSGLGQIVSDWLLRLHAIRASEVIGPMSFTTMITLLIVVFVGWYILGWIFAWLWNAFNK